MARLFEKFTFNFYDLRQDTFKVGRPTFDWSDRNSNNPDSRLIPRLETDVCLISRDRQILMDCKFYIKIFDNNRWGQPKINRDHLFQLHGYLSRGSKEKRWQNLEGILLYPTVGRNVDIRFDLNGFPVQVRSVDLNQHWTPRARRDRVLRRGPDLPSRGSLRARHEGTDRLVHGGARREAPEHLRRVTA